MNSQAYFWLKLAIYALYDKIYIREIRLFRYLKSQIFKERRCIKVPEEEIDLSTSEEKGWLGKIKDSIYQNWQTILVALIVLIVGISAYNYNQKTGTNSSETTSQTENTEQTASNTEDQEQTVEEKDQEAAVAQAQTTETTTTAAQPTDTTEQQAQETKTEETNTNTTNTVESNGEGYKVVAGKGEGITQLARKALNQYLSENNDSEITALHKIYIEDYLQNRIGSQGIEIGHAETISKTSIQEAIDASKKLSKNSLNNLEKYSTQ